MAAVEVRLVIDGIISSVGLQQRKIVAGFAIYIIQHFGAALDRFFLGYWRLTQCEAFG